MKNEPTIINVLKEIYDNQVSRRVEVNIDTTEKQFLFDMSSTLLRIEKSLNEINMKIEKTDNMNMVTPIVIENNENLNNTNVELSQDVDVTVKKPKPAAPKKKTPKKEC